MAPRDQGEGSKVVINVLEGERLHAKRNLPVENWTSLASYRRPALSTEPTSWISPSK